MSKEPTELPDIALREMTEQDKPFIFNSWLKSFKDSTINAKVPDKFYYAHNHAVIDRILGSDKTRVVIASAPDDDQFIHGYAIAESTPAGTIVHWVYVKFLYRNNGVATLLLNELLKDKQEDTVFYQQFTPNIKNFIRGVKWKKYE